MKLKNKTWLIFSFYFFGIFAGTVGSVLGTYAWFEYSTRAGMTYTGTAVGEGGNVSVGLFSERNIPGFENRFGLRADTTSYPGHYVYWSTGALDSQAIMAYQSYYGYANKRISPVSTGEFHDNDDFKLKAQPKNNENNERNIAPTQYYNRIPLVFNTTPDTALILEEVNLECNQKVEDALRVAFKSSYDNTCILFSPSRQDNGTTPVAGVLDLNGDGYYDYQRNSYGVYVEHLYGEYTNYSVIGDPYDGTKDYDDKHITTFNSNHKQGVYGCNYDALEAHYYGYKDLINKKTLCMSNSNGIGLLDMYVYLEGWDSCLDNSGIGYRYNLNLNFTI